MFMYNEIDIKPSCMRSVVVWFICWLSVLLCRHKCNCQWVQSCGTSLYVDLLFHLYIKLNCIGLCAVSDQLFQKMSLKSKDVWEFDPVRILDVLWSFGNGRWRSIWSKYRLSSVPIFPIKSLSFRKCPIIPIFLFKIALFPILTL